MAAVMGVGCGGGIQASKFSCVAPPKNLSSLQLGSGWRQCASSSSSLQVCNATKSNVAITAGGQSSSILYRVWILHGPQWVAVLCFALLGDGDGKVLRLRWVWVQRVRRWWAPSKWARRKWRRGSACSTALPLCTTRSDSSSLKPKFSLAVRFFFF